MAIYCCENRPFHFFLALVFFLILFGDSRPENHIYNFKVFQSMPIPTIFVKSRCFEIRLNSQARRRLECMSPYILPAGMKIFGRAMQQALLLIHDIIIERTNALFRTISKKVFLTENHCEWVLQPILIKDPPNLIRVFLGGIHIYNH